jgi:hypothetical protein
MQTKSFTFGSIALLFVIAIFVLPVSKVAASASRHQPEARTELSPEAIEADALLQNYYLAPDSESIVRLFSLLDKQISGFSANEVTGVTMPLLGFFSQVFKTNPDKLPAWTANVDKLSSLSLKRILFSALYFSTVDESRELLKHYAKKYRFLKKYDFTEPIPAIFAEPLNSPEVLDMFWGAFFATGDIEFSRKIMIRACTEQPAGIIDFSIAAARWSVIANAQQHKPVRDMLNEELRNSSDDVIKRFTEKISEEARQKIFAADVLLKVNHLQAPPAKAAAEPEKEEKLPAPPIVTGAPVNYVSSKEFFKLFKEANMRHTLYHHGKGQVATGKLIVEDQLDSLAGIASKALFTKEGIFVAPVYAGRTLRFVKHGYESLDIVIPNDASSSKSTRLELGTQILRKLPAEHLTEVTGGLQLPEGVANAQVELWTGKLPSTFNDDGYDCQAVIKALAAKSQLLSGQRIHFTGLSPIFSELRITAPDCIYLERSFEAGKDLDLGTITLQKCQQATFMLAQMNKFTNWKKQTVLIDGKTELILVNKPDKFGQYDGWRLAYQDSEHIKSFFVYSPSYFDDYGKMTPEQFIAQKKNQTLPKPISNKHSTILEKGHLYRFRCEMRNIDMLIAFVEMKTK